MDVLIDNLFAKETFGTQGKGTSTVCGADMNSSLAKRRIPSGSGSGTFTLFWHVYTLNTRDNSVTV